MPGTNWKIDLAWLASETIQQVRTVCECGVGPLDISIAPGFIGRGNYERLLLIEPTPEQAQRAQRELGVKVHQVAIDTEPGVRKMVLNGGSSYIAGTWAPTPIDPTNQKIIEVPTVTFDALDDGMIDVLNLDCEGNEWAVLSHMRSRPFLLVVEVWAANPYKEEIMGWLEANRYTLRFSTGPTSETHLFTLCT